MIACKHTVAMRDWRAKNVRAYSKDIKTISAMPRRSLKWCSAQVSLQAASQSAFST